VHVVYENENTPRETPKKRVHRRKLSFSGAVQSPRTTSNAINEVASNALTAQSTSKSGQARGSGGGSSSSAQKPQNVPLSQSATGAKANKNTPKMSEKPVQPQSAALVTTDPTKSATKSAEATLDKQPPAGVTTVPVGQGSGGAQKPQNAQITTGATTNENAPKTTEKSVQQQQ